MVVNNALQAGYECNNVLVCLSGDEWVIGLQMAVQLAGHDCKLACFADNDLVLNQMDEVLLECFHCCS